MSQSPCIAFDARLLRCFVALAPQDSRIRGNHHRESAVSSEKALTKMDVCNLVCVIAFKFPPFKPLPGLKAIHLRELAPSTAFQCDVAFQ